MQTSYNLYRLFKVKKPDQEQIEMKQKIAKANEKRKRLEAASQNLEHQKKFVLDLLHDKLQSCCIQEQQQTREALEKMIAEDEKSNVGFQIDAITVCLTKCWSDSCRSASEQSQF